MSELAQLLANGLVTGSIIAIAAIGLTLVYGILGIVNFAHGEYLAFGAFMAFAVNVTLGWPIAIAIVLAMGATALLGVGLEYGLWRPLRRRGAKVVALLLVSIGLALVLRHVIFLVWGATPRRLDVDVFQAYDLGGVIRLSLTQITAVSIAFAAILLVGLMLARTKLGKSMRAYSDNSDLASVSGIDVDRIIAYTWILGAGLAGLGGVLLGLVQSSFNPNLGFTLLLPIFAAVFLGGVGSAYGSLVGGVGLGLAMEVSTWSALAGGVNPVYKPVVAFAILILALLVRPQGLLGKARYV